MWQLVVFLEAVVREVVAVAARPSPVEFIRHTPVLVDPRTVHRSHFAVVGHNDHHAPELPVFLRRIHTTMRDAGAGAITDAPQRSVCSCGAGLGLVQAVDQVALCRELVRLYASILQLHMQVLFTPERITCRHFQDAQQQQQPAPQHRPSRCDSELRNTGPANLLYLLCPIHCGAATIEGISIMRGNMEYMHER